jgi:hypothetical protein
VPLKLLFTFHEVEAEFTEKQLRAVIILWWKRREIPSIDIISPKFYLSYIFHLRELFMLTQTGRIKLLVTLLHGQNR